MSSHHAILSRAALYIAIAALVVNMGAAGMAHERGRTREFRAAAEDAGARLAAKPPTDPSATLVFVGDIMLSREIGRIMTERNDWAYPFRAVGDTLARADLAIGNLEGPISNRGANQGSMYSFRANPRATAGLAEAGFDIMTVANNHIWDYGPDALRDTLGYLAAAGIAAVGGGENHRAAHAPAIRTVEGIRIAFLGYTNLIPEARDHPDASPATAYLDLDTALADIVRAKREADMVVILIHWGNEYETSASSAQQEMAHALVDGGARLVIGHHPHVVQEVEQYGAGLIAYSLGNFVFDQNFSAATQRGLMLRVMLDREGITAFAEVPVAFTKDFSPYPVRNDQAPRLR